MSTTWALVRNEAREARTALIAAPLLSIAVLGVVQFAFSKAGSVAYASSATVAILLGLWTVYLAADLFATDHASGRLQTRSFLPVRTSELWRAKLVFLGLAIASLATATIAIAYALQIVLGPDRALELFETNFRAYVLPFAPYLPAIAASAVLCSLVVESALVAVLLSLIVDACILGLAVLAWRAAWTVGIVWTPADAAAASVAAALALFAVGAIAFRRGQRRFGSLRVRVRTVASITGVALLLGGLATASEIWRRRIASLEHPRTTFQAATSSPDGRYLAVEVELRMPGNANPPRSVWVIDLETGEHELAASDALLLRDSGTWQPMPWDTTDSLRVQREHEANPSDAIARVRVRDGSCALEPAPWVDHPCTVPAWARVEEGTSPDGRMNVLTVRWPERVLERAFRSSAAHPPRLGRTVFLSRHPGRILHVEGDGLLYIDLDDGSERILVPMNVVRVEPSPDGSAVLVQSADGIAVFSTLDGARLQAPWPEAHPAVTWVEGSSCTLLRSEIGRGGRELVEDLETGLEFLLKRDRGHWLLHRLPDGGYVYVDENDDLVRVDMWGGQPEILVDR